MDKDTAPAKATFSAAGIAAVLLAGAWCGPAFGSSGIDAEILDDDAVEMPILTDAVTRSNIESIEATEETQDETVSGEETPAVITRLPGVSEAVLPSFRRQMYRTDI